MSITFEGISKETQTIINEVDSKIDVIKDGTYVVDKNTYTDSLKSANIDPDVAKKVFQHLGTFTAGVAAVVGEKANKAAKSNKELAEVEVKVPLLDRSAVAVNWRRESQSRNPRSGEVTTIHGNLTTKVAFSATRNSGDYGKIRNQVRERAAKALSK